MFEVNGMVMEGGVRCGEGAMKYLLRNRQLGARHVLTIDMIAKSADYYYCGNNEGEKIPAS